MIPVFLQLNADKNSSYLLRETMRRTVSQRDKVGFWFDGLQSGLPPVSVSGRFRIRTGRTLAEE